MPAGWEAVIQLGGVSGVAIFAIIILQRTWEGRLLDWKTTQDELVQHRQTLMDVVKANSAALADAANATRESITASRELCQEVRGVVSGIERRRKTDRKNGS